jgi:hypothetical protein
MVMVGRNVQKAAIPPPTATSGAIAPKIVIAGAESIFLKAVASGASV